MRLHANKIQFDTVNNHYGQKQEEHTQYQLSGSEWFPHKDIE